MIIDSVQTFLSKWRTRNLLIGVGAILLTIITLVFLVNFLNIKPTWYFGIIGIVGLVSWRTWWHRPGKSKAISHLHGEHSDLQYSLRLLEKMDEELNDLEKFQRKKLQQELKNLDVKLPSPRPMLKDLAAIGLASFGLMVILSTIKVAGPNETAMKTAEEIERSKIDIKKDSAYIDNMRTSVSPPQYTGLPAQTNNVLTNEIPEGSFLTWSFSQHGPVQSVNFHFGDEQSTTIKKRQFFKSGIYYYSVSDSAGLSTSSSYYSVKVKEDSKPLVELSGIEEYQRLPWKKNYDIDFNISIKDDYGIQDAFISATVADGQGESVKFREKTFPLKSLGDSQFSFSTEEFDMEPGSELYFYVMAKDNCPYRIQATKSTTYFVVLEDTVTYDYVEDAGMQVDLMPDFFRSQRQIIIDSEKLLKEKLSIPYEEFKQRSNELGFDQKMLRLKYGQFLGEEAESGIALENEIEDDHDHGDEGHVGEIDVLEEFGHNHDNEAEEGELLAENGTRNIDPNRPEWVEAMSHNHDDAEENTYFEVSLKTKLKAALSVMWDAELHLRLYDPAKSLPYQYEALKYLLEIKNHARIYVHRIGFDPPAIKVAEKRLTGEQEKIVSRTELDSREEENEFVNLERSIQLFSARLKTAAQELSPSEADLLQKAGSEIAPLALENPTLLPVLSLIRNLINRKVEFNLENRKLLLSGLVGALPKERKEVGNEIIRIHPVNQAVLKAL